jgi:hypothetical protein
VATAAGALGYPVGTMHPSVTPLSGNSVFFGVLNSFLFDSVNQAARARSAVQKQGTSYVA